MLIEWIEALSQKIYQHEAPETKIVKDWKFRPVGQDGMEEHSTKYIIRRRKALFYRHCQQRSWIEVWRTVLPCGHEIAFRTYVKCRCCDLTLSHHNDY